MMRIAVLGLSAIVLALAGCKTPGGGEQYTSGLNEERPCEGFTIYVDAGGSSVSSRNCRYRTPQEGRLFAHIYSAYFEGTSDGERWYTNVRYLDASSGRTQIDYVSMPEMLRQWDNVKSRSAEMTDGADMDVGGRAMRVNRFTMSGGGYCRGFAEYGSSKWSGLNTRLDGFVCTRGKEMPERFYLDRIAAVRSR